MMDNKFNMACPIRHLLSVFWFVYHPVCLPSALIAHGSKQEETDFIRRYPRAHHLCAAACLILPYVRRACLYALYALPRTIIHQKYHP